MKTKNKMEIDDIMQANLYVNWGKVGGGFGQLSVWHDSDGKLFCNNECMSRNRVREILVAIANKIADETILLDSEFENREEVEIPPFIKGISVLVEDFADIKARCYLKNTYVNNKKMHYHPVTQELMDIPYGTYLDVRGYRTAEEVLADASKTP